MNKMTNLERVIYYRAQLNMCQENDAIVPSDYRALMYKNYLEACSDLAGDLIDSRGLSASDAYKEVEVLITEHLYDAVS